MATRKTKTRTTTSSLRTRIQQPAMKLASNHNDVTTASSRVASLRQRVQTPAFKLSSNHNEVKL